MNIVHIKSKALKRYLEKDDAKLLPAKHVSKINAILTVLLEVETIKEFMAYPYGRPHKLKGDRDGFYAERRILRSFRLCKLANNLLA